MNGSEIAWREESRLVQILVHARGQIIFAAIAFAWIIAFAISPYLLRPYDGISYSTYGSDVRLIEVGGPGDKSGIRIGDRVLAIGGRPVDPCFLRPLFSLGVKPGETIVYKIQRGVQMLSLPVIMGGYFDNPTWFGPLISIALIALCFWAIGLLLCLFAPTQDVRSRLTGLYWLLAAIVMAGGLGIQSGFWGASTVMSSAWALLSGAFVAAHFYFPAPLFTARLRRRLIYGLAIFALLLIGWKIADDWLIKPCMSFYLNAGIKIDTLIAAAFLVATLFNVSLLLYQRSRSRSDVRRQVGLILWGIALGLGPFFVLTLLPLILFKREFVLGSYTVLFMVLVPLAYGYVIYQRKLLRLDFAINRLVVFFVLTWFTLLAAIILLSLLVWMFHLPIELALFGGFLAAACVLPSSFLRAKVQVSVNRILYGGHYDFYSVTAHFSSRLARALERRTLEDLLTREMAYQMGIRQIALFLLDGRQLEAKNILFTPSVDDELCASVRAEGKPIRAQRLWSRLSPDTCERWREFVWAELFVPIVFEGALLGLLMPGERSVGDVYSDQDLRIIATVAHQGAIAYANVLLMDQKRGLAQQLVRWEEEHRKQVALDLHDIVLPEVTFAKYRLQQNPPEAERILDQVTDRLRRMVTDQWTLMLDQGLELALQELVKEMQALAGNHPVILWRYHLVQPVQLGEEQVVAIYRVAQEAVRNALQHARAQHISVILEHSDGLLRLIVEDDGTGFRSVDSELMQTGEWHYGLLGMQERTAMIGGRLRIESDPGEGTTVILEIKYSKGD